MKGEDNIITTWTVRSDIKEQKEENRYRKIVGELERKRYMTVMEDMKLYKMMSEETNDSKRKCLKSERDSLFQLSKGLNNEIAGKTLEYMSSAPITDIWIARLSDYAHALQFGA